MEANTIPPLGTFTYRRQIWEWTESTPAWAMDEIQRYFEQRLILRPVDQPVNQSVDQPVNRVDG